MPDGREWDEGNGVGRDSSALTTVSTFLELTEDEAENELRECLVQIAEHSHQHTALRSHL